ncbi:MAG: U32 family peptidase C-terminal domain-containing protein [Candidatus Peregrinibacteria bacterium]
MELLLPAGSKHKAFTAFLYGADAVYCGCAMFSLRTRENKVTEDDLTEIVAHARKIGKKVYVTINCFPHEFMIEQIKAHLVFLENLQPDGIIFADLGVLSLANEFAPSVPKHLSVQTSTVNTPAIKMWQRMGVSRIILAREMAIKEVQKVHEAIPEMELEYFVHGAVCMAYSGRCLLSNFTGGRDANRGACNHTCRWNYRLHDEEGREVDVSDHEDLEGRASENTGCCGSTGKSQSIRSFEHTALIEEEERKGEMIPLEEDFHGTHIMSSKDMCMIEYLNEIQAAGVCSLKVEGRNKTEYYLATVTRAYRQALDDLYAGKPFDQTLWDEVHATANRGFFPGFLHGKPRGGDIQYEANRSTAHKEFCGVVKKWENGRLEIEVKNRIDEGNSLEFIFPKREDDFSLVAKDLYFGKDSVATLHGGDENKISTLACEKPIPEGIFIRQIVQNAGLMGSSI